MNTFHLFLKISVINFSRSGRRFIKQPNAEEVISYQIPAFKQHSVLVYFAAFKDHIGFFPTSKPIEVFKKELKSFKTSKGTIQFPLDENMPLGLIAKITKFRVKDDLERHLNKKPI